MVPNSGRDGSLNQRDFATVLGLSERQIRKRHAGPDNIPHFRQGVEIRCPVPAALDWFYRRKYGDGAASARARKLAAEARQAELNLAEREGELIPLEVHEGILAEACTELRIRVLNIPNCAPELARLDTRQMFVRLRKPSTVSTRLPL